MGGRDALDVLHSYQVHLLRVTIRRSHRDLRRFLRLLTRHSMKILSAVIISREEEGAYTVQLSLKGSEQDFRELLVSLGELSGSDFLKSFGIKKGRVFGSAFLSDSIRIEREGVLVLLVDWKILSSVIAAIKDLVGIAIPKIFEFCGERAAEEEIKKVEKEFYDFEKEEFSKRPMDSIKRFLMYFLVLSWYEGFELREGEIILKWGEDLPEFIEMSSHFICGFLNRILDEFCDGKMKIAVKNVEGSEAILEITTEK